MKKLPSKLFIAATAALVSASSAFAKTPDGKTCVLLLAGKPSHGPGEHEHNAGVKLFAKCLAQGAPNVVTKVHLSADWPNADELSQADTILFYADGGGGHFLLAGDRLAQMEKEMKRGAGVVCLHYAVEFPADKGGPQMLDWMGGFFEANWSVNPHWVAEYKELPKHPISSGVKPFSTNDEWYFHMRFNERAGKLTHVLATVAPDSTMSRGDGPHSGNPAVRAAVAAKKPQTTAWAFERPDGGRGFGFTGGHFHKSWGNDDQRKLVLNAILWTAKADVPANGVESKVSEEELNADLDPKGQKRKPSAAAVPNGERYGLEAAKKNMATFKTPDGLQPSLVAAEPMIQNPTNIEIDSRGRIWAVECLNYRGHMTTRPEGDRVVILEDTDGDGVADKDKTFYQNTAMTNPLGICVLPQAKGTKVIVSAAPNVWLLTDKDGDDVAEDAKVIFKVGGVWNYDHQIHAFVFGPDGKFYFNAGNSITELFWPDGSIVKDLAGNEITNKGKPYRQGMVYRCDLDLETGKASNVETLGHNFRNNYEVAVDSFGTMWQSDNDDDGNKGVRINYVMEFGNYGFTDEITGAGWQSPRTNLESEIPLRHWHLNDPGVVPNLLQTGGGSPTGILVNEGSALGPQFTNQLIHCDAGPRTVRAYPVESDGAGYKATMVDVLTSSDAWYRVADLAIAPDGSLVVADWYDPGVGGHAMGDHEPGKVMGRIYRVSATGAKAATPKPDFATAAGAAQALTSPNLPTQYAAWTALHAMGAQAEPELLQLFKSKNPRHRARALGLLARCKGHETAHLRAGLEDADENVRIAAIRLATTLERSKVIDTSPLDEDRALVGKLLRDTPAVRRQIALSLYRSHKIEPLWSALAQQHDGKDRWYLEALGIGSIGNEDACFDAWLAAVGDKWNTPAGRDIIWRLRSAKNAEFLAKLIADKSIADADKARYFRAFDFLPASPAKTKTLVTLASVGSADGIIREALVRLKGVDLNANPDVSKTLNAALDRAKGTASFIDLVRDFGAPNQGPAILETAVAIASQPAASDAVKLLTKQPDWEQVVNDALASPKASAVVDLLGTTGTSAGISRLASLVSGENQKPEIRQQAIRALARTQSGAAKLIGLAKGQNLPAELAPVAGSALRLVEYTSLKKDIDEHFPAPAALGGKPLPPLAELVKLKGDIDKGRAIFERAEISCVMCHRVGNKGADFGPALSEIGSKSPKEQIYENIVNPSSGLSMGFETTQLALKDGGLGLGIVRSETGEELVLALPGGASNKFDKKQIAKREKLTTSMMPSGLNQALTQDDLVNLVEYLSSLKTVK